MASRGRNSRNAHPSPLTRRLKGEEDDKDVAKPAFRNLLIRSERNAGHDLGLFGVKIERKLFKLFGHFAYIFYHREGPERSSVDSK